jgi:N-methylhydantoinase A
LVREADIRYAGQSMEVRVVAPAGNVDSGFIDALTDSFHAAHLKTFGYSYAGQQKIELVNFAVSGFGLIDRPSIPKTSRCSDASPIPKLVRPVYFDGAFHETPVYERDCLVPGHRLYGPLVIEEFGSTTVVFPDQSLSVDPHGILIIESFKSPTVLQ